jgi:hypothetical protein
MVSAPRISVYELLPNGKSNKVGDLFTPDQLYALGITISYVEDDLLEQTHETLKELVAMYKNSAEKFGKFAAEAMSGYFENCAQIATLGDKPEWKCDPADMTPGAKAQLFFLFFSGMKIEKEEAAGLIFVMKVYRKLVEQALGLQKRELPLPLKLLHFIVRRILRIKPKPYIAKFDESMSAKGLEAIDRLQRVYQMALEGDRVFTFDLPESETERMIDLGGVKIKALKDGTVAFE